MKAFLMFKDRDFDLHRELPLHEQMLIQDLELHTLFNAMSLDDAFLFEVAKQAVLSSLHNSPSIILYRQAILKDCLQNEHIIRHIYDLSIEALASERKIYFGFFSKYPSAILSRSIEVLQMLVGVLKLLNNIANEHVDRFESEGFIRFFTMLKTELDTDYFASIQNHLKELKFRRGVLMSAKLGAGNKGTDYRLRKPNDQNQTWTERIFAQRPPAYTLTISERDESGARALSELRDRGINLVADALARSTDHILSFFTMVRTELAFYIGCLNLHGQLVSLREPTTFPVPAAPTERRLSFRALYDVCLALTMKQPVVDNDVDADNKNLVIVTGANQGGKSTFLRGIGLSQLMMQSGMFVPAETFCANVCDGLFTHYRREEDASMNSGKLDEELSRMSVIADSITPNSMILLNESFAATNEREGSEIARQITSALLERHIKVIFVTHLYEFAHGFYEMKMTNSIFLQAQREVDGRRTFRLSEGEPLQTSYGADLYYAIFGKDD
jgi:DNA mismatch repair ATPase MutS